MNRVFILLFKNRKIYSFLSVSATIALLIYVKENNSLSPIDVLLLFIALVLVGLSSLLYSSDLMKRKEVLYNKRAEESDALHYKRKAEILLEVGDLCSWQYSISAEVLKFDSSANDFLGDDKLYYTYNELRRNSDIKKLIKRVVKYKLDQIDDEVYFPFIKKWFIVRGRCVDYNSDGTPNQFIGIIFDNTERKEFLKKVENLSITDDLTGLKNRRYFFEYYKSRLEHYKREGSVFSLAMIDLDFFKKVNDTYGHIAGDYVLKDLSNKIIQEIRPYDLVARIGGEEFIILFDDIDKIEAEIILCRIKSIISESCVTFNNQDIHYTFSSGVGDCNELHLYTENELISIIDSRLYIAKDKGRNLVISGR